MAYSQAYLQRVVGALNRVDHISHRRLFNGVGFYYRGTQFALLINDQLFFRADAESIPLYQAKAMQPFQPSHAQWTSNFYQLPDHLLELSDELAHWMRIAIEAANHREPLPTPTPSHHPERRRHAR